MTAPRVPTVELVALAIALSGCGRPKLKRLDRVAQTVDASVLSEKDESGQRKVVVTVHRDDCPGEQLRLTATPGPAADCLAQLAVGSHVEQIRAIYGHPPMSCGVRDEDPHDSLGGCRLDAVQVEHLGTPCPYPP